MSEDKVTPDIEEVQINGEIYVSIQELYHKQKELHEMSNERNALQKELIEKEGLRKALTEENHDLKQQLMADVHTCNKEALKNALAKIEELEEQLDHLKNIRLDQVTQRLIKERDELKQQLEANTKDFAESCKDYQELEEEKDKWKKKCKAAVKENFHLNDQLEAKTKDFAESCKMLGKRNQELRDKIKWQTDCLEEIHEATGKHTLKNIATIMKAAPPAEDLQGYEVEYGKPQKGESYWRKDGWIISSRDGSVVNWLIRTPIVEYIEGSAITDELVVANGGRVPCKVKNMDGEWQDCGKLISVTEGTVPDYWLRSDDGVIVLSHTCRIKKSDLKEEVYQKK